jgi:hypothetical protein
MNHESAKEYQRRTGCSWPDALDATDSSDTEALSGIENTAPTFEKTKQIGRVAIEQSGDIDDIPDNGVDEPGIYDPLDPYGIPDEIDSLRSLAGVREAEKYDGGHYAAQDIGMPESAEEVYNIDDFFVSDETGEGQTAAISANKLYKITEEELESIADRTGQSEETVLLERHLTRDDVEPSVNNK